MPRTGAGVGIDSVGVNMNRFLGLVLFLVLVGLASAQEVGRKPVFDSFIVNPHGHPSQRYQFSRSAASADDPILIRAVGRPLKAADRLQRVELQKVWLGRNVPKSYTFVVRSLVGKCGMKLPGRFHACDEYEFEDPVTRQRSSYFIYVGNWPD